MKTKALIWTRNDGDEDDELLMRARAIAESVSSDMAVYDLDNDDFRVEALIVAPESRFTAIVTTFTCPNPGDEEAAYHLHVDFYEPLVVDEKTETLEYVWLWGGALISEWDDDEAADFDLFEILTPGGGQHFNERDETKEFLSSWVPAVALFFVKLPGAATLWRIRCYGALLRLEFVSLQKDSLQMRLEALTAPAIMPAGNRGFLH